MVRLSPPSLSSTTLSLSDIVMTYSFARCDHRLEAPDFDPSYRDASHFGSTAENFMKHAPWLNSFLQSLPDWIAEKMHPGLTEFIKQKRVGLDV
jgi:hypothetical protein